MNRVGLVTGGARGIGAATARLMARHDYTVVVNYRSNQGAADRLVSEIRAQGGNAAAIAADVALEADVVDLFSRIDREFGPLAALVNNAGMLERQCRLDEMDGGRLARVLGTNVTGSFLCAREAVRRMSTRYGGSGGAIVNLSSAAARLGAANEYIDYAAAKGAVDSLTVGLAREVGGEGIRVNAVRPGLIRTDIHTAGGDPGRVERLGTAVPAGRGGEAHEVAEAIVWLLSDRASYVNGALLDVTGGR